MRTHAPVVTLLGLVLLASPARPRAATAGASALTAPTLRAHARTLDVRDGGRLWPGLWTADPSVPLDTYEARRSTARRTVTFYSDLDSLALTIGPGESREFTVLLDDSLPCRTRVSAGRGSATRLAGAAGAGPVEIPFTIGRDGKPWVEGRLDGSPPLRLLLDTGAATLVIYPSGLRRGVRLTFDGTTLNAGSGGTTLRRTSRDHALEIGGLAWAHEPVLYVEKQADRGDGIAGIDLFEDKVVRFDFARDRLVVYDSLPPLAPGFERFELGWSGTLPLLRATLHGGRDTSAAWFVINTGSGGTVSVNQAFAAEHGLPGALARLGTARVGGVGPRTASADRVRVPALSIGPFRLPDVPALVERPSREGPQFGNMLGMQVLARFDVVLDLRDHAVWLRPLPDAGRPFPAPTPRVPASALMAIAVGVAILSALAAGRLLRRPDPAGEASRTARPDC